MRWLNNDLRCEVRRIFEPRYNRKLTDIEVEEIAQNLVNYMENYAKFMSKRRLKK